MRVYRVMRDHSPDAPEWLASFWNEDVAIGDARGQGGHGHMTYVLRVTFEDAGHLDEVDRKVVWIA